MWAGLVVAHSSTQVFSADGVFGQCSRLPSGDIALEGRISRGAATLRAFLRPNGSLDLQMEASDDAPTDQASPLDEVSLCAAGWRSA